MKDKNNFKFRNSFDRQQVDRHGQAKPLGGKQISVHSKSQDSFLKKLAIKMEKRMPDVRRIQRGVQERQDAPIHI